MNLKKPRILILIVAYFAEKHIAKVFERIPSEVINADNVHILVLDDASGDASAMVASQWAEGRSLKNITVLKNTINQGYGGNQKLGYRFGVDGNFDLVILLHGDGQYAPEMLPKFIETWETSDADVLLGSRMQSLSSARNGGMPVYKIIGNRVLTTFQNKMTKQNLSEYHTGFRAYSTRFLKSVPFEINTNEFHFDTEILLQAFHARAKVVEFPIPTHYGDEICRVDGMKYAKDVILATMQYRMHSMGMFCSLLFRNVGENIYESKVEQKYSSHAKALQVVKAEKPQTVLDIGCGPGFISHQCAALGAEVVGVDAHTPKYASSMKKFIEFDLDKGSLPADVFQYDMVLMLDVIEHLAEPEKFMLDLRNSSATRPGDRKAPTFVISTPNVGFWGVRLNLLLGRFNYAERGILDITHKRLFTISSLRRNLIDCGYEISSWKWIAPPFELVIPGKVGRFLSACANFAANVWPGLFAFQILAVCKPRPGVKQLLLASEKFSVPNLDVQRQLNVSPGKA